MINVTPVSFEEISAENNETRPDEVIISINCVIRQNYNSYLKESVVMFKDIITDYFGKLTKHKLQTGLKVWDITNLYGKYGWNVEMFYPKEGEQFEPYFVFSGK